MHIAKIEKIDLKEKIMAVHCTEDIYIGLGKKFLNFSTQKILYMNDKCIRSISSNEKYIGCCSYDGTAVVFEKNEKLKEKIEGPDTEIKGIAFDNEFVAITTRGRTTWILENLEISKILEDHTQDVKGCLFKDRRLYTWSYDNTIKIYDLFDIDHSWELSQSIDLDSIVWKVVFFGDFLCAMLQNGNMAVLKKEGYLWIPYKNIRVSLTAIHTAVVFDCFIAIVCNRNCLLIFDTDFNKVCEVSDLNDGSVIFACDYFKKENAIVLGSLGGILTKVFIQ